MKQQIQILLQTLISGSDEEKLSCLIDIGDYIEMGHPPDEDLIKVIQELIARLPLESNNKIRHLLFRNIATAYRQPADLSELDYSPVIEIMDNSDPEFICNTCYILSLTNNKKYIAAISKYLSSSNEKIRAEAQDAINYLQ